MDALLRGQGSSEVIPFSLDDPVLYYPVRHHSPACAWHLEQVIRRYEPECILVEGPENADPLIPVLTDPATRAPVALYYAYRDDQRLLTREGEEPETFRCYYPFLDHSPELVALRAAAARSIPGSFMDLSYADILLATRDARGLRSKEEQQSYANDRYLASNRFQQRLCQKAGVRSFEEFWEKYFEVAGLDLSDEAFVRQMNVYCLLSRQNTPEQELQEDGCLAREAHMARRIRAAAERYRRVLVVAGGFHIWGLLHPAAVSEGQAEVPAASQSVYPMAYSFPAADALFGYASGMPSPGYYAHVWRTLHDLPPRKAWESVTLDYLVHTGRRLRQEGATISAFDETCALEQALGLAELRQKPAPGLYELQDAVLSSFVKGEASLSGARPLEVLRELTGGKTVGRLCDGALVPPLVKDFDARCAAFRLKREAARQELTLSVFSQPRHRELSRFLYQTVFLNCGFAQRRKGPDLRHRKDRNLIREIWTYRWTTAVETALIQQAVSGATVEEACAAQLRREMSHVQSAGQGAELLMQGFLMGIGDVSDALAGSLEQLLVTDGDFSSLCRACWALNTLEEWQDQYDQRGSYDYQTLLDRCFTRILQLLPAMGGVDDRGVQGVQQACMLLYQVTGREAFAARRGPLTEAFRRLIAAAPLHPALHGAVLGLLYGDDPAWKEQIRQAARGYLRGTRGMMLQSASFLQGLFYTARDLLLVDGDFLGQIDALLTELTDEDFTSLLPELRLAFSYFVPMETDRIARRAAALHGASGELLRRGGVDAAAYARGEEVDRWAVGRMDMLEEEGEDATC